MLNYGRSLEKLLTLFARNNINAMGFYYAVAKGRRPGIYHTWDECKAQVDKFSGPIYKKFSTSAEAQSFIDARGSSPPNNRPLTSSAKNYYSRAPPSDVVALGGRSSHSSSKRVYESPERNENYATSSAKRRKTVSNNDKSTKHFDMDPNGWVNVWTDGACSSNGKRGAKAGVGVYFGDDSPLNISEPVDGRATNNMAEIQAVTRAAARASEAGITKMRVNTDSRFLIDCVTKWMPGWKKRGWMTADKKPVINKQELLEMEAALRPLAIEWNHVRGHQGIHGNEQADRLAREGAQRYKK